MKAEFVMTIMVNGQFEEKVIGETVVTRRTDVRKLLERKAKATFDTLVFVRRDTNVFGWTAVDCHGNTIALR